MFGIVEGNLGNFSGNIPKFGLNTGCVLKALDYVAKENEYVHVVLDVNGFEVKKRYYNPERVFANGAEITDKNSIEFKEGMRKQKDELSSALNHIMGAVVGIELWHNIVAKGFNSFTEYAKKIESTFNAAVKPVKVDVFLSYPWTKSKNDIKFLELPRSTKYGAFMCKSDGIIYNEDRSNGGLRYVNGEKVHPFIRNHWFLNSEFANSGRNEVSVSTPANTEDDMPF